MHIVHYIFWICVGVIFYSYIGYGILLLILTGTRQLFKAPDTRDPSTIIEASFPEVTLVVAAYNEEAVMEEKIANCLSLNYPADKLSFLFITDGSDDRTTEIIARHPQIRLLHQPERKGKTAALNRAMMHVHTPITIFCDANTVLNRSMVRRIVLHYQNPVTGGVAGEKRVLSGKHAAATGTEEGLYWKYESLLKMLDAELYTVTGAAGELFSIKTALWEPLPEETLLDDFVISTRINLKGYRIAYEPSAYAMELPSASMVEEKKRKVRIAAGAFQAMGMLKPLFNVFKHPVLFFQFFSHRVLRWTLTPLCFPVLFLTNILLAAYSGVLLFRIILGAQVIFYLLAMAGACLKSNNGIGKMLRICYYILFMNYSVYLGFIRFIKGRQSVVWEKAERESAVCLSITSHH